MVVMNLSSQPRDEYRVGVPGTGRYVVALSTDDPRYGGAGPVAPKEAETEDVEHLGWSRSLLLALPSLGALVLAPAEVRDVQEPPQGAVPPGR